MAREPLRMEAHSGLPPLWRSLAWLALAVFSAVGLGALAAFLD